MLDTDQSLLVVSAAAKSVIDRDRRPRLQARIQTSQLCLDPSKAHVEALLQGFRCCFECQLLITSDSKCHHKRDHCRHGTDDCHPRHHHTGGNQTTRRCYGNVVAIPDRRQRGKRPPQ